jgi:hypothetical protein
VPKWIRLAVLLLAAFAAAEWWSARAPLEEPAAVAVDGPSRAARWRSADSAPGGGKV